MIDVIVTGGRDYRDWEKVQKVLGLLDIGLIVQGGATGADHLAAKYAALKQIFLIQVDADWIKHGRAAGPIRNAEMLALYPDAIVVAFPGGIGTANCVQKAIELGHTVLKVQ